MEEPGSSSNPSTPLCLKGTSLTSICCQRMEKGRTLEHSLFSHAILQPVAGQSSVLFCRGTAIYINGVLLVQRIKKHGLLQEIDSLPVLNHLELPSSSRSGSGNLLPASNTSNSKPCPPHPDFSGRLICTRRNSSTSVFAATSRAYLPHRSRPDGMRIQESGRAREI